MSEKTKTQSEVVRGNFARKMMCGKVSLWESWIGSDCEMLDVVLDVSRILAGPFVQRLGVPMT